MKDDSQNSDGFSSDTNSDERILDIESIFKNIMTDQPNKVIENVQFRNDSSLQGRKKSEEQEIAVHSSNYHENLKKEIDENLTTENNLVSNTPSLMGKSLRSSLDISSNQNRNDPGTKGIVHVSKPNYPSSQNIHDLNVKSTNLFNTKSDKINKIALQNDLNYQGQKKLSNQYDNFIDPLAKSSVYRTKPPNSQYSFNTGPDLVHFPSSNSDLKTAEGRYKYSSDTGSYLIDPSSLNGNLKDEKINSLLYCSNTSLFSLNPTSPSSVLKARNSNSQYSSNSNLDSNSKIVNHGNKLPSDNKNSKNSGQRPKSVSKFIFTLYELANSKNHPSLDWHGSDSFIIYDRSVFESDSLPLLSKTNEFSAFVRQLNGYGFRKQPGKKMIYKNEWFTREGKDLIRMKRANKKCNNNQSKNSPKFPQIQLPALTSERGTLIPSFVGHNLSFLDNMERNSQLEQYANSSRSGVNSNNIHDYSNKFSEINNIINYNLRDIDSRQLLLPEIKQVDRYGQIQKYSPPSVSEIERTHDGNTPLNAQMARLQLQIDSQQAQIEQLTNLVKDLILAQGNFSQHDNREGINSNLFSLGSAITENKVHEDVNPSSHRNPYSKTQSTRRLLGDKNEEKKQNNDDELDKYFGDYF